MASKSECLGSTGGGPDVARSLELHVQLLYYSEDHEQYEICWLDLGTAWSRSETKGEDVKLSCVDCRFIYSFR